MAKIEIVPLELAHLHALYSADAIPDHPYRGASAVLDGEVVAVAGLCYFPEQVVGFSKIKPEYRDRKVALAKMYIAARKIMEHSGDTVYLVSDPKILTSRGLALSLGFTPAFDTIHGEALVWNPSERSHQQ